ncbi:MAG TPA: hypothetical protein VLR49_12780, partial [Ferruginibacter sp.]|nr:hypothetical protein [Ferruginibacter sp.]
MVIYNVAKHRAIDFIFRNNHFFVGDSALKEPGLLQNFHLKPARIAMQVTNAATHLPSLSHKNFYWQFVDKKIILIDSSIVFEPADTIIPIDLLLISHNPSVKIKELVLAVKPAIVVFDASNSLWKIEKWKKECEELLLRCHSVAEQGA